MISKLKNRITFQSNSSVSDGAGGYVNTPVNYYSCWAEIFRENQNKSNLAGNNALSDSIIFRIRDAESLNITKNLTILYKGNRYLISSIIDEFDGHQYLRITCATFK